MTYHVLCSDGTRHTTEPLPGMTSAEAFAKLLDGYRGCGPHTIQAQEN